MRSVLGLGAVTACLAFFAATGVAGAVGGFNCGAANRIGGHKWAIQATGVSCGTARGIVRDLASKTVPRSAIKNVGIFPGTHAGMRCFGGLSGQKPKSITCGTSNARKLVRAARMT